MAARENYPWFTLLPSNNFYDCSELCAYIIGLANESAHPVRILAPIRHYLEYILRNRILNISYVDK